MNLKHPHDLVILMRQETTVNYLKELEVRQLDVCCTAEARLPGAECVHRAARAHTPLGLVTCRDRILDLALRQGLSNYFVKVESVCMCFIH